METDTGRKGRRLRQETVKDEDTDLYENEVGTERQAGKAETKTYIKRGEAEKGERE